jgi:DNA replication ATP-dependent helicase Dna2
MDHGLDLNNIKTRLSPSKTGNGLPAAKSVQVIFRIDKDELFGGMGRLRDNLARLFYADGDVRRLQLVVDLKPPRFYEDNDELRPRLVDDVCVNLNQVQQRAVAKVLNARDYALILGMPGTGKTTVTAAIIRTLVAMGKTVLLTSYTHSAVDTILLKLVNDVNFDILRLGNLDKVSL